MNVLVPSVPMIALQARVHDGHGRMVEAGEKFFTYPRRAAELIVCGFADLLPAFPEEIAAVAAYVDDPEIAVLIDARNEKLFAAVMADGLRPDI